jgi:hypothetical protein
MEGGGHSATIVPVNETLAGTISGPNPTRTTTPLAGEVRHRKMEL